jgi:hypothetical protein
MQCRYCDEMYHDRWSLMQHQKTHRSGRYRIDENGTETYIEDGDFPEDHEGLIDGIQNPNGDITFVNEDGNEIIGDHDTLIRHVRVGDQEHIEMVQQGHEDQQGHHQAHQQHQGHHQDQQQDMNQMQMHETEDQHQGTKLERIEDDPYAFDDGSSDYHMQGGPQMGQVMAQPVDQ